MFRHFEEGTLLGNHNESGKPGNCTEYAQSITSTNLLIHIYLPPVRIDAQSFSAGKDGILRRLGCQHQTWTGESSESIPTQRCALVKDAAHQRPKIEATEAAERRD